MARHLARTGDKVMIMVDTDGQENSSHEYDHERITALVEECKAMGWAFQFMANGLDIQAARRVANIGRDLGMHTNTAPYSNRMASYSVAGLNSVAYFAGDALEPEYDSGDADEKGC